MLSTNSMNYKIIATILRKELLETLRDRRTLFAMIGVPIILYPVLFIGMTQFTLIQQGKLSSQESKIAVIGKTSAELQSWIDNYQPEQEDDNFAEILDKIEYVQLDETAKNEIQEALQENGTTDSILKKHNIDTLAIFDTNTQPDSDAQSNARFVNSTVDIKYDNTIPASDQARSRITRIIRKYSDYLKDQRLKEIGITADDIQPLTIKTRDIAPPEKTAGSILGRILPMLMIINLALGAFYPALDQTAGEKERGTFETLLSTPARKTEIVAGKFLAIFTLALITAVLSLTSMGLTMVTQIGQMANAAGDANNPLAAIQISASTITIMLLILVPLAFFICSVMMSIALFARNFREAQHYVTPFYLAITMPAIAASFPTVELTPMTMLLPILNVALLFKELLIGNFSPELISGVFISTAGWATLALTISVKLFQSEQLILNQEKGLPITLKRSMIKPSKKPEIGLSLGLFALCLLGLFYLGTFFQSKGMISGIIITEWVFILLPVVGILWFYKINLRETLSLKQPKLYEPILALLLIVASNIIVMRLGIEQSKYLPMPEALSKLAETMMSTDHSWPATLKLIFAIAFSAAVCEEILFRGAVFSGLNKPGKGVMAITITAILFAIMHMSIYRLMPTFLLGMVLGYLTWRTGSIYNSMFAHFVNNSIPVLLLNGKLPLLQDWLSQFEGTNAAEMKPMPIWLLGAAIAVIIAVIIIFETITKQPKLQTDYNEN